MSKAYEMIAESLNEIITDLEENDGKNLKRETASLKVENKPADKQKISYTTTKYIAPIPLLANTRIEGHSYEN